MTALLFIVVVGWGILLDRIVKKARLEVGIGKAGPVASPLVFWSWVPIVSMAGLCFPGIFLGKDVARRLGERGTKGRWFNHIRLGAFTYLLLLFGIPVIAVLASQP